MLFAVAGLLVGKKDTDALLEIKKRAESRGLERMYYRLVVLSFVVSSRAFDLRNDLLCVEWVQLCSLESLIICLLIFVYYICSH